MSDEGELWRAGGDSSKERRQHNKQSSTQILLDNRIDFESHNKGGHLVVHVGGDVVDFWPSTGLWIGRIGGAIGCGVFNMLHAHGVDPKGLVLRAE